MMVIVGWVIVFGAVLGGYVMHHAVLVQPSGFVTIGGGSIGALIPANPPTVIKATMQHLIAPIKPTPFGARAYTELLRVLYELFQKARKGGIVGPEAHIEDQAEPVGGVPSSGAQRVARSSTVVTRPL